MLRPAGLIILLAALPACTTYAPPVASPALDAAADPPEPRSVGGKTGGGLDRGSGVGKPVVPVPPPPPKPLPAPSSPIPVTTCDATGCWDGSGRRYNSIGTTMIRSDGKVCQQISNMMQCN